MKRRPQNRTGQHVLRGSARSQSAVPSAARGAPIERREDTRTHERRFLDKCINHGEQFRNRVQDGRMFLSAAMNYSDKMDLLVHLTDGKRHGKRMLKAAVSSDNSIIFLNDFVVPFLALIGGDELCSSMLVDSVQEVVSMMYGVPGLMNTFVSNFQNLRDKTSVGWFVIMCCKHIPAARNEGTACRELAQRLIDMDAAAAKPLKNILRLDFLLTDPDVAVSDESRQIIKDMELDEAFGVADLLQHAGGRHDNDYVDYREVHLLPTAEEMMCDKEPSLPKFKADEASILDRQFRLLREDVIGPARQELKLLLAGGGDQRHVFQQVRFLNLWDLNKRFTCARTKGKACIRVSFNLPIGHKTLKMRNKKEREDYWDKTGFGMLPLDALVCFLDPETKRVTYFATVVEREASALASSNDNYPRPVVGLSFQGNEKEISSMLFECGRPKQWQMIQISNSFFSYKPILRVLQSMDTVPLARGIFGLEHHAPKYLSKFDYEKDINNNYATLNLSQKEAIRLAVRSEVSLTQGPPGTGKTFIGVALTDMIYRSTDKTILCICYTNHALDQFLEALLDKGITNLIRIGGRSKSTRLEPYNIREKAKKYSGALSSAFKRRVATLYNRREVLSQTIATASKCLNQQLPVHSGNTWHLFKKWLDKHEKSILAELTASAQDEDGFDMIGEGGKALKEDWKWRAWMKGQLLKKKQQKKLSSDSIWLLTAEQRKSKIDEWSRLMGEDLRDQIAESIKEMTGIDENLKRAHKEPSFNILKQSRVIGCTTTGAAMNSDILNSVKPGVIIAEEAAEILEAHILTSSSNSLEHLIMIGDHKQLRPKIENHKLSVESGNLHDLNQSMFERMVQSGCQHSTLLVQHRMRPEISELIHHTYPGLEDHESVLNRPDVRGVKGNVFFIDHSEPETQLDNWKQQHESKTNQHEAAMVANVARYLLRQDYKSGQIVILTPYLGQLFLIQKMLVEVMNLGIFVDDKDINELKKASGTTPDMGLIHTSAENSSVRVATIDNYQGEEADFVIASLVRSNADGQIGFLKEPERLNVLLSRAKFGLFLVGNATCMRNARNSAGRKMWNTLLDKMDAKGQVQSGLPAECYSHGRRSLLSTTLDFENHAPSGGCKLQCGKKLPCGHFCPFRCHRFDPKHQSVRCTVFTYRYCDNGHMVKSICGEKNINGCDICDQLIDIEKKREQELTHLEEELSKKMQEYALERSTDENDAKVLQKQLDVQNAEFEQVMERERRKVEMERKQRELEMRELYGAGEIEEMLQKEKETMLEEVGQREQQLRQKKDKAQKKYDDMMKQRQDSLNQQNRQIRGFQERLHSAEEKAKAAIDKAQDKNGRLKESAKKRHQLITELDRALASTGDDIQMTLRTVLGKCKAIDLQELMEIDVKHAITMVANAKQGQRTPQCTGHLKKAAAHLRKEEWLEAYDILQRIFQDDADANAMLAYCEARLDNATEAHKRLISIQDSGTRAAGQLAHAVLEHASNNVRPTTAAFAWSLCALTHPESNGDWSFIEVAALELVHKTKSSIREEADLLEILPKLFQNMSPEGAQKKKWEKSAGTSSSLNDLLKLTGMDSVKKCLFELNDKVKLDIERGLDYKKQQFNIRFDGNPGTGKTTVARIYGTFLKEKQILPNDIFIETSGSALINGGTAELKRMLEKMGQGGVLFIDEAYQLNPKTNALGAQILDYLLPEMENRRGSLVVIIAGYAKRMDMLMSHNEGLPSRFPHHFTFEDYSDEELFHIFRDMIDNGEGNFKLEDEKYARVAARRLGRQRGLLGFGNARAVRNMWDQAKTNQSARILQERDAGKLPDLMLIKHQDLLGPLMIDASSCSALKELMDMRGLKKVKESINALLSLVKTNAMLELAEKPLRKVNLNRIFLGNPGTGKTTVAGIYGRILKDLGMLSNGQVVLKTPQDFVGTVLGESEKNTKAILDAARGKVLVIDEAYGLAAPKNTTDPYRTAVIDTIVAEVQGVPGDDRCVLLLGYKEEISSMIRDANPGLARRFQMSEAFEFEDYNDEDLLWMLQKKAKHEKIKLNLKTAREAVKTLAEERRLPNFGNAGAINNLLSRAVQKLEKRLIGLSAQERAEAPFIAQDFLTADREVALSTDPTKMFDDMIGVQRVKSTLIEMQQSIEYSKQLGKDPLENLQMNFLFAGSPGTGKTTVARKMGKMLSSLGLLAKEDVIECSASDFVTGFVNQAGGKTREMFRSALGGLLFIDEAYRLNPKRGGSMMSEVLDEIVNILTEEQFKNKMAVIFAGYHEDLDDLMQINPGLKSRISKTIHFDDFDVQDCIDLLKIRLEEHSLSEKAQDAMPSIFERFKQAPYWSNGRDVETFANHIFQQKASSVAESGKMMSGSKNEDGKTKVDELEVSQKMVEDAAKRMLEERARSKEKERDQMLEVPDELRKAKQAMDRLFQDQDFSPKITNATLSRVDETERAEATDIVEVQPFLHQSAQKLTSGEEITNHFHDIPVEFLHDLNDALASHGIDMTNVRAILNFDKSHLFTLLSALGNWESTMLLSLIEQWDLALVEAVKQQQQIEEDIAKKKIKQRPRWRCAVCGRMGCQVAPYIEGYDEIAD